MRAFFSLLFLLLSLPALADMKVSTQIFDIDMGRVGEEPLIFLSSGQVVTYPLSNKELMDNFHEAMIKKKWFEFTINNKKQITAFREIEAPAPVFGNMSFTEEEPVTYVPSILKSMDDARAFFYSARMTKKAESQCYNRAHVWTYEWRTKKNLYSSKVWLFFTRRFIRKYKFDWWFHVAPMVHVVDNGAVRERVMDIKYARGPVKLKQWTDIFMRDSANCPVVEKYTDQANYPESGSCFVMKSSMYYYQPVDLEQLETANVTKSRWLVPEVRNAYKEAFDEEI